MLDKFKATRFVLIAMLVMLIGGCREAKVRLPPSKLSTFDLQFGKHQVDKMMHDRPRMSQYVERDDIIFIWMARQFGGEAIGRHISWSAQLPDCDNCPSDYYVSGDDRISSIRLADVYQNSEGVRETMTSEQLWRYAIYEMYNISRYEIQGAYTTSAIEGKLTKKEWMDKCMRLEFDATQLTKQFYLEIWKPWSNSKGLKTESLIWYLDEANNYNSWLKQPGVGQFLKRYYSKYYDEEIVPRLRR